MRSKLILAGLAATLLMGLVTTTGSARNLSVSHGNLWRATWGPLNFKNGSTTIAACNVTLEGSFHAASIAKVAETLLGLITRATVDNATCPSGHATILQENLPWHIRYGGFEGTLPEITGVRIKLIGARFRIQESGIFRLECLATTTEANPAVGIARLAAGRENRLVTGLTADSNARIPCSIISGSFEGTARVTEQPGGAENLLLKLI